MEIAPRFLLDDAGNSENPAERIGRSAPLTLLRGARLLTLQIRPAELV